MNFDFSPEQEQFREQVRRLLERAGGIGEARALIDGASADYSRAMWSGLAEMGALAIAISEAHGGLGLGLLEQCVVAEEIGRSLAPVPFLSSIVLCAEAIRLFGSPAQQAKWLPSLADGSVIGTWGGSFEPAGTSPCWAGGRLEGHAEPVLDGMAAQLMVVLAADEAGRPVLALCDLAQQAVGRDKVATIDPTRPAARIGFAAAAAEPLPGDGGEAWSRLRARAAVLLAFEQLGAAEAALAMACAYATERTAFGRRIGSFQAIKHKLVDIYTRIELARGHCYYGAWAVSTGSGEAAAAVAGARCSATDALDYAAQENIQTHGGIGVTWELNCQLFYRRARLCALLLGSRYEWQDRLVAALADQSPGADAALPETDRPVRAVEDVPATPQPAGLPATRRAAAGSA